MVVNKSLFQSLQSNQNSAILSAQNSKSPNNQASYIMNNNKTLIQKPQRLFQDKIDNSYLPFVPKLRNKPNALRTLPGMLNYFLNKASNFS